MNLINIVFISHKVINWRNKLLTTIVKVFDDDCEYKALINVSKISSDLLSIKIQINCSFIRKLAAAIGSSISKIKTLESFNQNIVYSKLDEATLRRILALGYN
jgi:hypothetical protein